MALQIIKFDNIHKELKDLGLLDINKSHENEAALKAVLAKLLGNSYTSNFANNSVSFSRAQGTSPYLGLVKYRIS